MFLYPRINPAVIVGVVHGDALLLAKYRTGFAHNALVAGFTEFGETLEETVAREVMEEFIACNSPYRNHSEQMLLAAKNLSTKN